VPNFSTLYGGISMEMLIENLGYRNFINFFVYSLGWGAQIVENRTVRFSRLFLGLGDLFCFDKVMTKKQNQSSPI
jgi:hypothetical protein